MHYDVEADWTILLGCNYRCDYCYFSADQLSEKIRARASPEEWRRAFDATGRTWLLHLTGGEPTAYPNFVGLCETLTGGHYVSINTNLSLDGVLGFIGRIDPARVHYFHASFHPGERDRKRGLDGFIRRAIALRDAGFVMLLTVVATPAILERFDEIVAPVRQAGLQIAPKILRESYRGRNYPESYSEEDKARFRAASLEARRDYDGLIDAMSERPTIDVSHDIDYLDGVPSFRYRKCDAGRRFVAIDPDGAVVRCGTSTPLGNVLEGSLRLRDRAATCNSKHCVYFCEKYAAPLEGLPKVMSALHSTASTLRHHLPFA
jgi:MoaA/NifB/PqqE/SkfB family radical SAM enzyme